MTGVQTCALPIFNFSLMSESEAKRLGLVVRNVGTRISDSSGGQIGPPPCCKRKVRIAGKVCAYVYGLVGVFNDPGPGWNALRSVPI